MPIFEYRCEECGDQFEVFLKRSDERILCRSCKSKDVTRLFSAFAARSASGGGSAACSTGGT